VAADLVAEDRIDLSNWLGRTPNRERAEKVAEAHLASLRKEQGGPQKAPPLRSAVQPTYQDWWISPYVSFKPAYFSWSPKGHTPIEIRDKEFGDGIVRSIHTLAQAEPSNKNAWFNPKSAKLIHEGAQRGYTFRAVKDGLGSIGVISKGGEDIALIATMRGEKADLSNDSVQVSPKGEFLSWPEGKSPEDAAAEKAKQKEKQSTRADAEQQFQANAEKVFGSPEAVQGFLNWIHGFEHYTTKERIYTDRAIQYAVAFLANKNVTPLTMTGPDPHHAIQIVYALLDRKFPSDALASALRDLRNHKYEKRVEAIQQVAASPDWVAGQLHKEAPWIRLEFEGKNTEAQNSYEDAKAEGLERYKQKEKERLEEFYKTPEGKQQLEWQKQEDEDRKIRNEIQKIEDERLRALRKIAGEEELSGLKERVDQSPHRLRVGALANRPPGSKGIIRIRGTLASGGKIDNLFVVADKGPKPNSVMLEPIHTWMRLSGDVPFMPEREFIEIVDRYLSPEDKKLLSAPMPELGFSFDFWGRVPHILQLYRAIKRQGKAIDDP
jgi:hypothetical protein